MKPGYILKSWVGMDFIFPHWTLYGLFWVSLVLVPVPISFAHHSGPISYKTGLALGTYLIFIFCLVYMLAAFMGYKYTQTQGGGVKNYEHQRHKIVAAALPIGAATLYFTGYLITIPFGHAPNYTFTLKPSPQLEMELNHLLGEDTIEYTPFDYSLDEQEITYVTNGIRSKNADILFRTVNHKDKIVKISSQDMKYILDLVKGTNFFAGMYNGKCYYQAKIQNFLPREIYSDDFKSPIKLISLDNGNAGIDTKGVFEVERGKCDSVFSYNSTEFDYEKKNAIESYILYPHIYFEVVSLTSAKRPTLDFSLSNFDNQISNF
ncbi:hypothetical protein [Alkalimarinus sediminis]|uniref:Uncharacterized protein n=2 Tax=Alkalimarinus sediminis TaxID=1632866 RepID=A0A9E8KJI5_9ALTE|nr:hypothetical protein [Alkalimarinus sediminis]UZW75096.1 hypothetical protein NNL22_00375 [Alkalimarinus sediminis]